MTSTSDIGFIGIGTLATAVVRALRKRGDGPTIRLSPRSQAAATALASELPNVVRETSNQSVLDRCGTVILSVRPQQLAEALQGLSFRRDQVVISFVAKLPLQELQGLAYPAERVCRVTPLPSIENHRGPIILYPDLAEASLLFAGLGDVVPAGSEDDTMALGCVSGLLSTFFELEAAAHRWLVAQGVPNDQSSLYVRSMFSGLAATARERLDIGLPELADEHQTRGGLNERGRNYLRERGFFDLFPEALDRIAALSLGSDAERG